MVLLVNLLPRLRMNSEQALPSFFDGNRVLSREMVTVGLVLISLAISLRFRSQNSCNLRLKGIPEKVTLR